MKIQEVVTCDPDALPLDALSCDAKHDYNSHLQLRLKSQKWTQATSTDGTVTYTMAPIDNKKFLDSANKCTTMEPYVLGSTTNVVITGVIRKKDSMIDTYASCALTGVDATTRLPCADGASCNTVTNLCSVKQANDAFAWSIDISGWPFCVGTTDLDVVTAVRGRGGARRDGDGSTVTTNTDISDGKKRVKPDNDQRAKLISGASQLIDSPLTLFVTTDTVTKTADVKSKTGATVIHQTQLKGGGLWSHYQFPVKVNVAAVGETAQMELVRTFHYDPELSFTSPTTVISPAVIAGAVVGAVVGVAVIGMIIRYFKRPSKL